VLQYTRLLQHLAGVRGDGNLARTAQNHVRQLGPTPPATVESGDLRPGGLDATVGTILKNDEDTPNRLKKDEKYLWLVLNTC
jgi:hypothetical protein